MIEKLIELALEEDVGSGDITTLSLIDHDNPAAADVYVKEEECILAGIDIAKRVFTLLDPSIRFSNTRRDGSPVKKGERLFSLQGPLQFLLTGERTALNFLQRLSGVATMTHRFVREIEGTGAVILDTRKTTPGWRNLEKYAVRMGGGWNHRAGLYDGILIKENHIKAAGGIERAVEAVRGSHHHLLKIEVETETMEEVDEAIRAGADVIMLDNMDTARIKEAVGVIAGRAKVEVSGNVRLSNVREFAETGVDYISVGAITHSAPAVDMSMII